MGGRIDPAAAGRAGVTCGDRGVTKIVTRQGVVGRKKYREPLPIGGGGGAGQVACALLWGSSTGPLNPMAPKMRANLAAWLIVAILACLMAVNIIFR